MPDTPFFAPESVPVSGDHLAAPLTSYVSYLLWQATLRVQERIAVALAPLGLRVPHHSVLRVLAEGPYTQVALADFLHADRMTMVRLIDDLERAGLVRRNPNARDRRAYDVTLTTEGQAILAQTHAAVSAADAALLAPLSVEEQVRFQEMLVRVIEAHDRSVNDTDLG